MGAALDRRTATMLAESVAYGQLQVEKLRAIATCRRIGHRLTELYPAERDRVSSYFRPILAVAGHASRSRCVDPGNGSAGNVGAGTAGGFGRRAAGTGADLRHCGHVALGPR